MTPQEMQILQNFLNQLTQARGITKDPQAETLIASAVAQQPDAAYLLVQRAMLLEQALNQSKAQIVQLQNDLQQAQARTPNNSGFLDAANAWGNSAANTNSAVNTVRPAAASAPANFPQSPVFAQAPAPAVTKPGFFSGNTGSFLTSVAATAAGVAGGAFLFQGIESLMGHHQSAGFLGQSGMTGQTTENTTINNYYGTDTSSLDANSDDFTSLNDVDYNSDDDGLTSI